MHSTPEDQVIEQAEKLYLQGQVAQAIAVLKSAIKTHPTFYQSWLLLSKYLFTSGFFQESIMVCENAEQFDPLLEDFQKIQVHMQQSAFAKVEKIAMEMLQKQPGHPRAIFSLAHITSLTPTPEKGIEILNAGLDLNPANLTLRYHLIETYDSLGHYDQAVKESELLTQINQSFDSYWTHINILHKYGLYDELLVSCEQARELAKADKTRLSQIDLLRGEAMRILGDRDASVKVLHKSLAENPNNAEAWWALADLKNYSFSDHDRGNLSALLNSTGLDNRTRSIAAFSLAKATESTNDWKAVMDLYNRANSLYPTPFNSSMVEKEFENRIQAYSSEAVAGQANTVNGPIPIFIVGLPRSGSTLVEQILASHSVIEGTIEQPTLQTIERQAQSLCYTRTKQGLYESLTAFKPEDLSELGQSYLNRGKLFRKEGANYFTDKNPFNFRNIGLIHKILPDAIIIDVRRNPLDCGFSLYKQYFSSGVDFSYSLSHIGDFYNSYLKLMSHWHQILPGRVLTLQYEELVREPVQQIRLLLEYVGVDFEQACVQFHETKRQIRTASSEQVRTPINTQGIGSWRSVEKYLTPLIESLGQDTLTQYQKYLN